MHTKPKTPKAPLPNKVLQALGVAWDSVPEEVQKNLKEAGYKPPKAQVKEEVDDLTDLCQKHEAALPEEVKAYLKGLKASQEVTPSQAASQASQSWQAQLASSSTLLIKRLACRSASTWRRSH